MYPVPVYVNSPSDMQTMAKKQQLVQEINERMCMLQNIEGKDKKQLPPQPAYRGPVQGYPPYGPFGAIPMLPPMTPQPGMFGIVRNHLGQLVQLVPMGVPPPRMMIPPPLLHPQYMVPWPSPYPMPSESPYSFQNQLVGKKPQENDSD
jgi:hypothetical protein